MKLTPLFLGGALAIFSYNLPAQEPVKNHVLEYRAQENFTELVGVEIWNLQNEKLGTIKYLTADLENGRLVEVVVKVPGGFLGMGGRTTALPPRALIPDGDKHVMRLDVSRERFAASPDFDRSHMMPATQRERVAEINRYYGLEPWFFLDGQKVAKNTQILRLGHVEKTGRILNMPIVNTRGEYIGRVGTLMMDLPKGQIVHVISVNDDRATPRSVIQARALRFNAAKNGLILDDTQVELAGQPHFKWNDAGNTTFQQETYVDREVKADHGLHSKQNEQEGIVRNAIPMQQGQNFRDEEKTRRIEAAIQADPDLSATAKDIEVVTMNSQTTLRGHVHTAEGKQRIGEIATRAGRPENVSNLIEVKSL